MTNKSYRIEGGASILGTETWSVCMHAWAEAAHQAVREARKRGRDEGRERRADVMDFSFMC